jgi:hypothetical protein
MSGLLDNTEDQVGLANLTGTAGTLRQDLNILSTAQKPDFENFCPRL